MPRVGWVKPGLPTWRFGACARRRHGCFAKFAGTTGAGRPPPPSAPTEARGGRRRRASCSPNPGPATRGVERRVCLQVGTARSAGNRQGRSPRRSGVVPRCRANRRRAIRRTLRFGRWPFRPYRGRPSVEDRSAPTTRLAGGWVRHAEGDDLGGRRQHHTEGVPTIAKVRSWVGLDVHAAKVVACVVDAESGEMTLHRLGGATTEVVAFCCGLPRPTRVAYEAGPAGYGLARAGGGRHRVCGRCAGYDRAPLAVGSTRCGPSGWRSRSATSSASHGPGQLMAYVGLVPSEHSTGQTRRQGHITKSGSQHARRLLVEAA